MASNMELGNINDISEALTVTGFIPTSQAENYNHTLSTLVISTHGLMEKGSTEGGGLTSEHQYSVSRTLKVIFVFPLVVDAMSVIALLMIAADAADVVAPEPSS
ncbi:hypothetical protein CHS0354_025262 [Potamilus streckersoni]|uniref:Uncharacterized protein n=1 Tax=Potamilus streckersoni TaxID=2493646 RepID=A0AAE0VI70_9BIVA|nr:hypothetical protein CHS0354_025262 [Potamilus streckersoni]